MKTIDLDDVEKMVSEKYNLFHFLTPEGQGYCFSKTMPAIKNSYFIVKIPIKFAKSPVLYPKSTYYKGWFWWAEL